MAEIGCSYCKTKNNVFILRCCKPLNNESETVYCSTKCQSSDWPSHKLFCNHKNQNIPDSEEEEMKAIDSQMEEIKKSDHEIALEMQKDEIKLFKVPFPVPEKNIEESKQLNSDERNQKECLSEETDQEEKPIEWKKPNLNDDNKKIQISIMSQSDGMKHIKLRFVINESQNGEFSAPDFQTEHIDSVFEATSDVLENYEEFLLVSRREDSLNNFAAVTFEADFSPITQAIRSLKSRRKEANEMGDRALEMQFNHDILSLIGRREEIADAYNKAKYEVTRNGMMIIDSNNDGLYNFAGSSPSRNQACFFYKGTVQQIFEMIHEMGNFSLIPDTEKRAKRIGLLFSSIRTGLEIKSSQWEVIEDVENEHYNFTDGCGFISPDLINKACSALSEKKNIKKLSNPSVVQVRFLGFKGILLLKKELKNKIQFRKSMLKFEVKGDERFRSLLGVLAHSVPFGLTYLSLQSVMLLSALGVPDLVFFDLQNDYFDNLANLLSNPKTAYKFCLLRDRSLADLFRSYGFTKVVINRLRLLRRNEMDRSVKKVKRVAGNKYEVERLRILVPEARLVYGVCDPYGKLGYDECYFAPTLENGHSKTFDNKEVIVFRNPCYHLGDIRKLKCVDFKDGNYEDYKDVIIFPTKGPRPHSNEMSSGDLDGDMYSVIWDTRIVTSVTTAEPFSCSMPEDGLVTKNRRTTSTITELFERQKWFAMHSSNNSLGQINSAFVKYANRYGPGHSECVNIGAMFNMSLDSGIFDQVRLREISRRVNSSGWEDHPQEERVWNALLRNGRSRRKEQMADCGIVVFVRREDRLAVAQCRKRERIFLEAEWRNASLKPGDCVRFGVRWNRARRILMAEDVVLSRGKRCDLVQRFSIPRLFGTVTRARKLNTESLPQNMYLPEALTPSRVEGYIFFEHTYVSDMLAALGEHTETKPVASYVRFDDRSLEESSGSVRKGDKVSFALCFNTDGTLAVRELRRLRRPEPMGSFSDPGEEISYEDCKRQSEGAKEEEDIKLIPFESKNKVPKGPQKLPFFKFETPDFY